MNARTSRAAGASFLLAALAPAAPAQEDFEPIRFGDPSEWEYAAPFFTIDGVAAAHDPALPAPEELLGAPVGARMAHHHEIVAYLRALADAAPRAAFAEYGRTYEGRELVVLRITSEANHARMAEIGAGLARLADPRGLDGEVERALLDSLPAVAWMGYSIHGDETSGADAALAVAHHLAACTDARIARLLEEVVVVLDPDMNPDGRERILSQVEQGAGYVASLDHASMHRGRWPYGRGNHYLFDMNRDWMAGVAPETRARWRAAAALPPQLFVDAHEMSGLDTFLFYPQAAPHHAALPRALVEWQGRFADAIGGAFDREGWGYYTREWADAWYVGYSDSWGSLRGAIGMLYEQGRVGGQPLRRASGEVVPYREAVHGQALASMASLETLAAHRRELLEHFVAHRRRYVDQEREGAGRCFVVPRTPASGERAERLAADLLAQGIEVFHVARSFELLEVEGCLGEREERRRFADAYLVPASQPLGALVEAYLAFDPRMDEDTLRRERRALEREDESKIYDVTAWDLARSHGLVDAAWGTPAGSLELAPATPGVARPRLPEGEAYAWLVPGESDASVRFAARALELGVRVHLADEPFEVAGSERRFPRGSLLVRRHENGEGLAERVRRAAADAGVELVRVASGRSPGEGPDLGGEHFALLERPRIAMLANAPVSSEDYGHLWQHLDVVLRVPFSALDAQRLGSHDLRRYNVLVLPPAADARRLLEPHAEELVRWIEGGGTLVAIGSAADALTKGALGVSEVVLRGDALEQLEARREEARRELATRETHLPSDEELWGGGVAAVPEEEGKAEDDERAPALEGEALERHEKWAQRFAPAGAILRGLLRPEDWLTAGRPAELPVPVSGPRVLLAREPVRAAVRLAEAERLRLGGLLWPEARERLALSAWATVERRGRGQVVLFAHSPVFRGSFTGTARLFSNAVVYGPGAGAEPALPR